MGGRIAINATKTEDLGKVGPKRTHDLPPKDKGKKKTSKKASTPKGDSGFETHDSGMF